MLSGPGRAVATRRGSCPDGRCLPMQAAAPGTPCARWPGSVGDFPWPRTKRLCRFCVVSSHPIGALLSVPLSARPQLSGFYSCSFWGTLAEALFYLQDGRNPSRERQRRASPATRRDNRYPSVIQVGNFAVCPLSVLTSILILNESRKIFLS